MRHLEQLVTERLPEQLMEKQLTKREFEQPCSDWGEAVCREAVSILEEAT